MAVTLSASPQDVPLQLAEVHHGREPGSRCQVRFHDSTDAELRADLVTGGGFSVVRGLQSAVTTLSCECTLPDTVHAAMKVLVCGLNPSPASADSRVAFARPGNRFWPAALRSGLASVDRDPTHALTQHGLGMTDIVKRTTRKASELTPDEFAAGMARVERMTQWLAPTTVCFVGLAGWRSTVQRHAVAGWQEERVGGRPVYLMPSTSGLNASTQLDGFVAHFGAIIERIQLGADVDDVVV